MTRMARKLEKASSFKTSSCENPYSNRKIVGSLRRLVRYIRASATASPSWAVLSPLVGLMGAPLTTYLRKFSRKRPRICAYLSALAFSTLISAWCWSRRASSVVDFSCMLDREYPTREHIRKMPFLARVIRESLRLFPLVSLNNTRGGGPDGNSPILVRCGELVVYSQYVNARRKSIYGDGKKSSRLPLFQQ
jgi:hypothetical protein